MGLSPQDYDSTVVSAIRKIRKKCENCLKPDQKCLPIRKWLLDSPLAAPYCTPVCPAGCWGPWPTGLLRCSGNSLIEPHTLSPANSEPRPQPGWHSGPEPTQTHTHIRSDTTHELGSAKCHELFGTQHWHRFVIAMALIFSAQHLLSEREAWARTGAWENHPKKIPNEKNCNYTVIPIFNILLKINIQWNFCLVWFK